MSLFSRKSTFILGSLVGSIVGLLFAREAGKDLREKMKSAKTPQKKFEALFQEYLKAGKSAIDEAKKSESIRDLLKGGKEANEVLREIEKQTGSAKKKVVKKTTAARKKVNKTAKKVAPKKKKTTKKK